MDPKQRFTCDEDNWGFIFTGSQYQSFLSTVFSAEILPKTDKVSEGRLS